MIHGLRVIQPQAIEQDKRVAETAAAEEFESLMDAEKRRLKTRRYLRASASIRG